MIIIIEYRYPGFDRLVQVVGGFTQVTEVE